MAAANIELFYQYLIECGATGLNNAVFDDFEHEGRGLKATRDFTPNQQIISIPLKIAWSVEACLSHPVLGPIADKFKTKRDDVLALLLIHYKQMQRDFPTIEIYKTLDDYTKLEILRILHVSLMPAAYSNTINIPASTLSKFKGSQIYDMTMLLNQQTKDDFDSLTQHSDKLFSSLADYKWALCTIWSRGMDFLIGDEYMRVLVPFVDMINNSKDFKQCHQYNMRTQEIQILAGKELCAGDQIFINYGVHLNSDLMRLYGFTNGNQGKDVFELYLNLPQSDGYYELKAALLAQKGLAVSFKVHLTLDDPLPEVLMLFLGIQIADYNGLREIAESTIILKSSSLKENLLGLFQFLKERYSIGTKELDILLNTRDNPAEHQLAEVCMAELSILDAAIEKTRNM